MSTPPPISTEKKGMSCLAMGGIGCLVLIAALVLGGGALLAKKWPEWKAAMEEFSKDSAANPEKATAKLGLKFVPDLQIVREDDAAKTITFKVGAEGEELTMHYDGMASGKSKPKITNSKGEEVNLSQPGAAVAPAPEAPAPEAPAVPAPPAPPQN
jgi:hypothetical protein